MSRAFRLAAIVALTLAPLTAFAHGKKHEEKPQTVTLTGEVMDLVCYMQHPESGQGAEHAQCAKQCINKGLPPGLKVGEQLYLLMGEGHASIIEQVAPLAGKQAKVTGRIIEQAGLKALVVTSIAPAG